MDQRAKNDVVISVRGLRTQFGENVIHNELDLDVRRGEVLGVVGASGTGKSVLLKAIVGLIRPTAGTIHVFGNDVVALKEDERIETESRWGVQFQGGALFSSLTVAQNVQAPMREHLKLPQELMDELSALKISMVGLDPDAGPKFPHELSGGMKKRAGLARALSLDPEIVFLDEPTAGHQLTSAGSWTSRSVSQGASDGNSCALRAYRYGDDFVDRRWISICALACQCGNRSGVHQLRHYF